MLCLLQLAAFMPYLLADLVAPDSEVAGVHALWVLLTVAFVLVYRRNRMLALAVPGMTVLIGCAVLVVGGAFLGWEG